jgi:DNA-binding transcriptional LysR family regulator
MQVADLNSLVIFAKVVEAKGFSEAARRLKIPLSTVSRRVAELEDQLKVRLLERSTRNLRLTDIGAEVLEHAQRSAELSEAGRQPRLEPVVDGRGRFAAFCATEHLRHSARPVARRVPGNLPECPGRGFGHQSVCRPYR